MESSDHRAPDPSGQNEVPAPPRSVMITAWLEVDQ
jgi:hypothetical protein